MLEPDSSIQNPSEFVGHQGLVRRILSRLGADRPQSVAIVGGPKSGKTSLINYLSNSEVLRKYLEEPDLYISLSCCCGLGDSNDPDGFFARIENELPVSGKGSNVYERIGNQIEQIHVSGQRLILFLDDFHVVTNNELYPLEFFSFLRSVANNYNLAYVTTSQLELQKLCAMKEVEESPFFNIFTYMQLGMISLDDAIKLTVSRSSIEVSTAERLVSWCGNSPYVLARAIATGLRSNGFSSFGSSEYVKFVYPDLVNYFSQVVSTLPPQAWKALKALKKSRKVPPSEAYHLNPLIKQGFLSDDEGSITAFGPAFAFFLSNDLVEDMLTGTE